MQQINKKFVKPGKISDHLKCPICFQVFTNATRLYCGHTFCQHCLNDTMKITKTCPQCRTTINKKQIGIDLLAQQIINDLDVYCGSDDCPWKGKYQELQQHCLKKCRFYGNSSDQNMKKHRDIDEQSRKAVFDIMKDDEVIQKINQNIVKGSLTARILAKTESLKEYKIENSRDIETTQHKQSKKCLKRGKKGIKQIQNKQNNFQQEILPNKTSNFDFLSSLFE